MNGSVADMPWTSPLYMCYENGLTQWWVVLWYLTSDSLRCYVMISWMHGFCRGAAVPLHTCDSMSLLALASQFSPAWFLMATPQTTCLDQSIIDHCRLWQEGFLEISISCLFFNEQGLYNWKSISHFHNWQSHLHGNASP